MRLFLRSFPAFNPVGYHGIKFLIPLLTNAKFKLIIKLPDAKHPSKHPVPVADGQSLTALLQTIRECKDYDSRIF